MFAVPLAERTELRPLHPWQAEEFLANLDRARDHIAPWVSPTFVATDLTSATVVLQGYADRAARDAGGIYGIWRDDVLVGGVMFVTFSAPLGTCEVGCWLEPAAEGHGLVTVAVRVLLDWAFRVRGLRRAEWVANARNVRSLATAARLGLRRDGTLRQAAPDPCGGGRVDLEIWSVLAEEWPAG